VVPDSAVELLLVHEPDYADEAPRGFSLQFSGHPHGGQVRIPMLPPIIVPTYSRRYPEGLQQARNHLVYTTRGVGMVGPKFRLFCPPEVGLIRLKRA
jgi:predicted MPP superfamily phosphohydrolase